TVTPSWTFSEQFHNEVDLKAGLDGLLKIGEFTVHVPGLGDRTFGPLYEKSFHFVDTSLESLFDKTKTLFSQTVPLAPFTIGANFPQGSEVTTFADSTVGGVGSLRNVILSANGRTDPVVIQLGAGTYNLTIQPDGTNDGTAGDLSLSASNVTIVGAG